MKAPKPVKPAFRIALLATAALMIALGITYFCLLRPSETAEVYGNYQVSRDIAYAAVNGNELLLDIYRPNNNKTVPVIVWIHGGAFISGTKEKIAFYPVQVTERGYALVSINYRLSQEAVFPAQIFDCKAAIRWLRANGKKYHLDAKKIGVWGESAGAFLGSLLGTTGDVESLEGSLGNLGYSSRVQAVCHFYGPTDFLQLDAHDLYGKKDHGSPSSGESLLIGGPIQENVEKVKAANPITYITKDDPPFLIMHGEVDSFVPCHQSVILYEALKKLRLPAELVIFKGAEHGHLSEDVFFSQENMDKVLSFFDKYLKGKK